MQRPHGVLEAGPVCGCAGCRVDPFRQVGAQCHSAGDGLAHGLGNNPGGQRIDGFDEGCLLRFSLGHDQVGMQDLDLRAIAVAFAGDDPGLADRQQLLQIIPPRVEINEVQKARAVIHADLVGLPLALAGYVFLDNGLEGDDLVFWSVGDAGLPGPVHNPDRLVKQDILDPRSGQFRQQSCQPRSDAGQGGDVLEQRKENLGAHRHAVYRQVGPLPPVDVRLQQDYMRPS